MSLRLEPIGDIPAETAGVARAAFPKGTVVTRLRDGRCCTCGRPLERKG
jgi:transposase